MEEFIACADLLCLQAICKEMKKGSNALITCAPAYAWGDKGLEGKVKLCSAVMLVQGIVSLTPRSRDRLRFAHVIAYALLT